MSRKLRIVGLVGLLAAAGGGAWAWRLAIEPPPEPGAERTYEDIPREEYEQWMQELGYTE